MLEPRPKSAMPCPKTMRLPLQHKNIMSSQLPCHMLLRVRGYAKAHLL
jgi:hypothetical protein